MTGKITLTTRLRTYVRHRGRKILAFTQRSAIYVRARLGPRPASSCRSWKAGALRGRCMQRAATQLSEFHGDAVATDLKMLAALRPTKSRIRGIAQHRALVSFSTDVRLVQTLERRSIEVLDDQL
nr:hypothetical protein CFP56_03337 [Quercus suber]